MDVKKKLQTLALTVAGLAAVAAAQAQPAPAPSAPPPGPAPTATVDPNAPPAPTTTTNPNAPPAPTTTSTAQPAPPPPGTAAAPQDPNAPPAPPPVAQPQPQPQPLQPAPPPVAQPQPVPQQPAPQPAQPAAPPAEKPKGMTLLQRFAATAMWWNHTVGLSTMGFDPKEKAADYCGAAGCQPLSGIDPDQDFYSQSITFRPAFFIYRDNTHQVRALTNLTINTELTNSDLTTYYRQPDINDIPITLNYTASLASWGAGGGASAAAIARDPTLAGAAEYKTWGAVTGTLGLPTSRISRGSGMYLTTSLGASLRQQIKLFGSSSDYLPNIIVTLAETWQHQFWRATTATNPGINIPRVTAGGDPLVSDQLWGVANIENRLIHSIAFQLPVYGDLMMFGSFNLNNNFPHQFKGSDCEVPLQTGCVDVAESENKMRVGTGFDISAYYQILPELGLDLGYNNTVFNQLAPNSRYRNPFASPNSVFYADIYVFIDQFVKRVTDPPKPKNQTGSR